MKAFFALALALVFAGCSTNQVSFHKRTALSDGKTFKGWFGDTTNIWRVENGSFTAGDGQKKIAHNEFLKTERSFTNFVLRVKVKLLGTNGFVNGGVQIRSTVFPPFEMKGYQCDVGEGWWGALYDESRRNKVLIKPNAADVKRAVRNGDWNDYVIRAEGKRVQTWINDVPMIDYIEADDSIPQHGLIGVQVHGGGVTQVYYKDIMIEELP
ncbi:MAG TPA: DUF1080 domain-containing protein [Candidatus Acidoferrum sp.]|nr:DUF1080 domain-containing protein [Candidatus Acidoferrum sp.]